MTKNLRIGIVGCGRMGRERGRASVSLGAQVALVCDQDAARAHELAELHPGSKPLTDFNQIDWSSLDAIFVCTPPSSRGAVELAAVRAGVPFFIEKPVGVSAEQCFPILEALRTSPVVNSVGYMNRHRSSVLKARELITNNEPLGISCNWVGSVYQVRWWLQNSESGGPFNEQGTHLIDLCRFFIGEIVEVFAVARPSTVRPGITDTLAATLRFSHGTVGTLLYSCCAADKQIGCRIFTPTGSIQLEGWDFRLMVDGIYDSPISSKKEDIFVREVAAFFKAIADGDSAAIKSDLEDAVRTQLAVDAIFRSLTSGQPQSVPAFAASL